MSKPLRPLADHGCPAPESTRRIDDRVNLPAPATPRHQPALGLALLLVIVTLAADLLVGTGIVEQQRYGLAHPAAAGVALVAALVGACCALGLARAFRRLGSTAAAAQSSALVDPSTGLPNGRAFADALRRMTSGGAQSDLTAVVAVIELGSRPSLPSEDAALIGCVTAAAARIQDALGPADQLARLGDRKLGIVSRGRGTDALGEALTSSFARPFQIGDRWLPIRASIGLATPGGRPVGTAELLRRADIALGHAARDAATSARSFTGDMLEEHMFRARIERDLRATVASGGLRMVYQPFVDAQARSIKGVEALVRWSHPELGVQGPATFVPIAEAAGLMPEIGRWIIEQSLADAAAWPNLEVGINLTADQIAQQDFVDELERVAREHGVPAARIALEISETTFTAAGSEALDALRTARLRGFRVVLDDFGTGLASIAHLGRFGFDRLKLDGSLVADAVRDERSRLVVEAIIGLGHAFGTEVVAERVEDEAAARLMQALGCDALQGFYFAKPVERGAIDAFFAGDADIPRVRRLGAAA